MNYYKVLNLLLVMLLLSACMADPVGAFKLSKSNIQLRDMQSRVYRDINEQQLLAASAALIQDMGYNIVESETRLGVITASKEVDATNPIQVLGALVSVILGGHNPSIDDKEIFTTSVVVLPRGNTNVFSVRMTMQQVLWNTNGRITAYGTVLSKDVYRSFFEKLSKSVYFEKNKSI